MTKMERSAHFSRRSMLKAGGALVVSIGMPMPKIAFLPVFMLWFGLFDASKILLVAFSSVFPVIVASWSATDAVDKFLIWSARSAGAGSATPPGSRCLAERHRCSGRWNWAFHWRSRW